MGDVPAIAGGTPIRHEFLPFQRPWTDHEEEAEVIDAIRSGWMTMGPKTIEFERRFAEYIGCREAVSVSSCTAALHLGLVANCVGPGDEIITSPITFAATANVIVHQGAVPVFVDVEPDTLNLDAEKIEAKITPRTRGIIPVHFCGHACDMDTIAHVAQRHGLFIVEDAAHAVGASYKGKKVGTLSNFTAFSFYATKNMTTGEGGMITTDDEALASRCRILRLHGLSLDAWKRYGAAGFKRWEIIAPGYKYNLTDLQSALGLHQLKKLDHFNDLRAAYLQDYRERLADLPEIEFLAEREQVASSHHMFVIKLRTDKLKIGRNEFLNAMQAENIGVGIHFETLHLHPFYREKYGFRPGMLPIAEDVSNRILSLPLYPRLTEEDRSAVVGAVRKLVRYYRQ